ncbi:hypothetical protein SASPL_122018 [Salvia splendens]|uniref:Small ribosomal subunit protein uS17 n=1 Tax=Salvia splendens TaxID=180675 RepID=A0A8X8XHD4_SALSN|nr:hypothetical protein SASPL_122018 [Salvia splendens]
MAEQTEKAFLKQPKVFLCSKKSGKGKAPGKGGNRYWKNIGLGFKTPREAIEGGYHVSGKPDTLHNPKHIMPHALDVDVIESNIKQSDPVLYSLTLIHSHSDYFLISLNSSSPGTYIDKKCPFVGDVSIRGRILAGTCHSAKMMRTIIVRRNYLHWVKKYQRYEKRHSNIPAHISPCFRVKEGDHVTIGQCRPLSKTVRFNVLKVIPAGSSGLGKKAFTGM